MSDRSPIIQLPGPVCEIVRFWQMLLVNPPLQESAIAARKPLELTTLFEIVSDRLTIISRSGRVFEKVNCWQVLLVNPPLQELRSLDRT